MLRANRASRFSFLSLTSAKSAPRLEISSWDSPICWDLKHPSKSVVNLPTFWPFSASIRFNSHCCLIDLFVLLVIWSGFLLNCVLQLFLLCFNSFQFSLSFDQVLCFACNLKCVSVEFWFWIYNLWTGYCLSTQFELPVYEKTRIGGLFAHHITNLPEIGCFISFFFFGFLSYFLHYDSSEVGCWKYGWIRCVWKITDIPG